MIKKIFNHFQKKNIKKEVLIPGSYSLNYIGHKYIYKDQLSSTLILETLNRDEPCLIARFGTTELSVIEFFIDNDSKVCKFPDYIKKNISDLSGFFPVDDSSLTRFSCESIDIFKNIDILGVRCASDEEFFYDLEIKFTTKFCKHSKLIDLNELPAVFVDTPWTSYLEGKKVLVIHPFEDTILKQYKNRDKLFANNLILPEFELITIKAVQSLSDNKSQIVFSSWYDALQSMKDQIDKIEFDIALIGCGAYGLFLGDYIKNKGKKAVHMGGALQVLFGIKGKRWTEYYKWDRLIYNEYWVSPSNDEKPLNFNKVEDGCYW